MKLIGAAIRSIREQRGLTLERLAMNAGISYQYLSGIETGKENFSIAILEKVAKALNTPMLSLITTAYAGIPAADGPAARSESDPERKPTK